MSTDKSLSSTKKVFLVCVNNFSLDAQNVLLKMFEEPIENTHFFLVVPDVNALLKTLVSRFYLISNKSNLTDETEEAKDFIAMSLKNRIDFMKKLLVEDEEEWNEVLVIDSARSKALKFLNALEFVLHQKVFMEKNSIKNFSGDLFTHFFKVREFLRMSGSSTKNLMESVSLIIPEVY
jgi:DNA polymerase III delta prime subunit